MFLPEIDFKIQVKICNDNVDGHPNSTQKTLTVMNLFVCETFPDVNEKFGNEHEFQNFTFAKVVDVSHSFTWLSFTFHDDLFDFWIVGINQHL